jgi:hypothetical protein
MEHDSAPGQPLMPPSDPHSGVELRHLRYLVGVAEAGTFTQVAERMFMAQPTLSQQVAGLDRLWPRFHPAMPDPLDAIELGKVEPELRIPAALSAGDRRVIDLDELVGKDVVHSPRRASPAAYDAWLAVLRAGRPCFEFIGPPSRLSLAVALAFAATASRPTAVLSSPLWAAGDGAMGDVPQQVGEAYDMARVRLGGYPLTATAAVAWSGDLPRHRQQVLFGIADAGVGPLSRSGDG